MTSELELLHRQIAQAQRQLNDLTEQLQVANEDYDIGVREAVAEFEKFNPAVVGHKRRLAEWQSVAQQRVDGLLEKVKDMKPDAMPVFGLSGFTFKHIKIPVYDEKALRDAAMRYAPWLLKLDEDAVRDFAFSNCDVKTNQLTGRMGEYLPLALKVEPQLVVDAQKVARTAGKGPLHDFKEGERVRWKGQEGTVRRVHYSFVSVEVGNFSGIRQFWDCEGMEKVEPPVLLLPEAVLKVD